MVLSVTFTFRGNQRIDSVTQIYGSSDVLHQRNHSAQNPLLGQDLPQGLRATAEHDLVFTHIDELLKGRVQVLQDQNLFVLSEISGDARNSLKERKLIY